MARNYRRAEVRTVVNGVPIQYPGVRAGAAQLSSRRASFVQIRTVLFVLGWILCGYAVAMLIPLVIELYNGSVNWRAFGAAASITLFSGGMLLGGAWTRGHLQFRAREGFLLTTLAWVAASVYGGLPFCLANIRLSFTDAFFETASALTTTGSTVIEGLDKLSKGILFWRALMQGIGGMGIIVLTVALLPFLRVGGMQLFRTESSDKYAKAHPRAAEVAMATLAAYLALTLLCTLAYWIFGMSLFDAICHAMPTISTAGFSNYDDSFAHFKSPALEWVAVPFMLAGSLPFTIYVSGVLGRWRDVRRDSQARWFIVVVLACVLAVAVWIWLKRGIPLMDSLRLSAFNIVSIITTTGFVSADFNQWGGFATLVFFMVMFVGGCTGSTAGGIKVMRWEILGQFAAQSIRRLVRRNAVMPIRYQGQVIDTDTIMSVTIFCFVYFMTFAFFSIAVAATGLDMITSMSSIAQAMANAGPGLGEIVGPAGNFKSLSDLAKWLISIAMILGRLEFMAVLVLFTRRFWRG